MAKMRGIKPETFTDDKVLQLTPLARWLFIGLWTVACDNGHVEDNLVQIKVRLLPMDSCDTAALMQELFDTGQLERHDGYLKVPKMTEHQKIDKRFLRLCEWCEVDPNSFYTEGDRPPRPSRAQRGHVVPPPGAHRGHTDEGEGEGEGERKVKVNTADKPRKKPATTIPDDWKPNAKHQEYAAERRVDLSSEAFRFRNHAHSVDRRVVNWNAAFTNWLSKAYPPRNQPRSVNDKRPEGW